MTFTAKRVFGLLLLAALSCAAMTVAHAGSTASVVKTHPSDRATLGRNESFWVHIEYATDEPISLWARPYRNGTQIKQARSNASMRYTGSGDALGWFSLTEPDDVDEVRIVAGGGKPYREWELARYPVELRWTNAPSTAVHRPQWVEDLLAIEKARDQEDAERRAREPVSGGEAAFFNGFMLIILALVLAGIGVPLWSVWKWRGGWKIAAAVPAAVVVFVVLRILLDTARDPTSHNLWPFEILIFGTVALGCIGVLKVARRIMNVEA